MVCRKRACIFIRKDNSQTIQVVKYEIMFSKNIIALISNKIQYFLYFVQKNHVTYFTVMKEPAFSYLGSMWASTSTNRAPIVLYEVSIFVLIVGCDAHHIAPKKFNKIAFSAE